MPLHSGRLAPDPCAGAVSRLAILPPDRRPREPCDTRVVAASTEISGSKITDGGEIFGRLVAVRRAGLGLSQEDLAARMDSSQSDVAHIEEGRPPSTEALNRLAPALDVEPAKGALGD